ncbi:MAG: energy-coupling factor ABC transporter permease [Planctomycetota bacterium]|jgi:cobalt/nickel transport system permease protein|nr:energy-coupling factor ABC transporter permease [Planctomycetota bacterium]
MHMADALISPAVGGVFWAATAGLAAHSARKIRDNPEQPDIPLMGVMGAFVFAAQMINFSIPGTGSSGHLGGGLLLAILLGPWRGFLTLASVLLIQCLFFADGGLLAWGCNVFNLGFYTCFLAYPLLYLPIRGAQPTRRRLVIASLVAAVVGLQLGAFSVVLETLFSGVTSLSLGAFILLMQPIHLAIGVVEGLATAALVCYVWRVRPEILAPASGQSGTGAGSAILSRRSVLLSLAVLALLVGGFLSWFASPSPDGLEWALEKTAPAEAEVTPEPDIRSTLAVWQEKTAILPDYGFPADPEEPASLEAEEAEAWPAVNAGTSLAGVVGSALTLLLAGLVGLVVSRWHRLASG